MTRIGITYDATAATGAIRAVVMGLSGDEAKGMVIEGMAAAQDYSREYHTAFNHAGAWKGKRYLGANFNSGDFGEEIAKRWQVEDVTRDGATLVNDADFFGQKVRGGTIRPKSAKALTIPMILEAKGLRARDYVLQTGRALFTIRRKDGKRSNALFEATPTGIRAVYALVAQVTQDPWPNALPPTQELANRFAARYEDALELLITRES